MADSSTPDLAWEAANFYLVQGDTDKALREFRVVMESDPYLPPAALKLCWRVKPDIDALLRDVVPRECLRHIPGFPHLPEGDGGRGQSLDAAGATAPADSDTPGLPLYPLPGRTT